MNLRQHLKHLFAPSLAEQTRAGYYTVKGDSTHNPLPACQRGQEKGEPLLASAFLQTKIR